MLLEILKLPDKRLRTKASSVTTFDNSLQELIDNMFETMYDSNGIGLAGTQVNRHLRLFVVHIRSGRYTEDIDKKEYEPLVFINPTITKKTGEREYEEKYIRVLNVTYPKTKKKNITTGVFFT